jgi:hypothetical protein
MLQGQMNLQRFDARGLTKEEVQAGIDALGLDRFLQEIHKNGHWEGKNRILTNLARCLYYSGGNTTSNGGWLNAPSPGSALGNSTNPGLAFITLHTTSTEPVVTESYSTGGYNAQPPDTINPEKRFDTDGIVDVELFKDPTGKESAIIRQKFMWLPGEATSSSIRSIAVYGAGSDATPPAGYLDMTRFARWRIKDSGGNPVTLSKLDQEVLLLTYSLILYSK